MVSQRELQTVVEQINAILERLDKRITAIEAVQNSLLHDLKETQTKKKGRPKNG